MPTVLVIGGTGQTGPLVIEGLVERGYDVTILHSGVHEPPLPPVEHIHADVHFTESIASALAGRTFDLALCMYGRARLVADELRGRVNRMIVITGAGYAFYEPSRVDWGPFGVTVAHEDSPFAENREVDSIGPLVRKTEDHILRHQEDGHYGVTILRYPNIFGPNSLSLLDWSIVRRVLDKRPYFIVAEGGLRLRSRAYRDNAAHAVLLTVDNLEVATGQIYNVADDPPWLSLGQWAQALASALGHEWQLVDLPIELTERIHLGQFGYHRLIDTSKIRDELGYADVVSAEDAAKRTALWWAEHGRDRAATGTNPDRFDYEAEDRLVTSYRRAVDHLLATAPAPMVSQHMFRHPQRVGDTAVGGLIVDDGAAGPGPRRTYPYKITSCSDPRGSTSDRSPDLQRDGTSAESD